MTNYRKAEKEDMGEIMKVISDVSLHDRKESEKKITDRISDGQLLCCVLDDKIVGFLGWDTKFKDYSDCWYLEQITIQKGYRGKGIGQDFIKYFLQICRESRTKKLLAHVQEHNTRSLKMFLNVGGIINKDTDKNVSGEITIEFDLENNRRPLPKIFFKQIPLELETEMISDFFDTNWAGKIIKKYPEFSKCKNKEEIRGNILKIRGELGKEMDSVLKDIKYNWEKVGESVLERLEEIIQTAWPEKEITAFISINPICPRFLDTWSFSVSPHNKNPNIIIAHEISHFLYFKKFKEIFPDITADKYESPNKEWLLSEIITPIILNDQRITKIIGKGSGFYDEHRDLKVDGESLIEMIKSLYNKFVIKQKNFSEFVRQSMEVIKKIKI